MIHTEQAGRKPTCRVFQNGQVSTSPHNFEDISEILCEEGTLVWFDVIDPRPNDLDLIQQEFDLHPLAIEDAEHAHQRSKIESYGTYWFVVIQGVTGAERVDVGSDRDAPTYHEIAIFVGERFLVTVRHSPVYPLHEIEQRWHTRPERLRRGTGFLLYSILDTVVDGYFPVADQFEADIDHMEDQLIGSQRFRDDVLPRLFQQRRNGIRFRQAVAPIRDILNPIIRGDVKFFPAEEVVYFRDVYDHSLRVLEQLDTIRDLVASILDMHLSLVANRQNEVSKGLTMIATIFLPLSFLVGFFGQNFGFLVNHIVDAGQFWGIGVGSEALALAITVYYFRRKDWL